MKRSERIKSRVDMAKQMLISSGRKITPSALARELNCSESTVHRWLGVIGRDGVNGRKDPKTRKSELLQAAVEEATKVGFTNLTRQGIAHRAGVSEPMVNQFLGTLKQLKNKVMRDAIKQEILEIIASGLALRDPRAMRVDEELKQKAKDYL